MKKEREIYLRPLTHREQVVMEQGICSASIIKAESENVSVKSTAQGYNEIDASSGDWDITWDGN